MASWRPHRSRIVASLPTLLMSLDSPASCSQGTHGSASVFWQWFKLRSASGGPHRVSERSALNTVQLLNRNNKQTIGVVNKQLAWSSHRGLQKPFLMSVWTKFGYLSAPVMTIIHKKTKKLPQKAKKRRFTFSKQRRKFLTTFPLRRLCAAPANFCPKPHHFTKNGQKNTVRTENKHSCL